jgi:SSS family solute:Na+ symporter
MVSAFAFARAGGWHFVMTHVSAGSLTLIRPAGDPHLPWPGLVLGIPLLGLYFWCTNQLIVQRALAARSLAEGRRGCLFAGYLKLSVLFIMVLPGTCAILIFPRLGNGDLVFPNLVFGLLPAGFAGVAVAGFLCAVMSCAASALNATASVVTFDVLPRLLPRGASFNKVGTGRIATLVVLAIAVLWAPEIARFPSLWQYLQSVLAFTVPAVVAIYLGGIFWPRANAAGASAALATGFGAGVALFAGDVVTHILSIQFLLVAPIIFVISVLTLAIVSLATAPQSPRPSLIWSRTTLAAQEWSRNDFVLTIALAGLTGWLVRTFW